ncbi:MULTISPECIES: prephenate dehydrogenase [Elizabethkingia]|uniref:Prephenate/arogenate dehydrogenase domain-containing protein n=2 Tax=Elizabethkingia anophelis TaxID=1117645 RepID=A0A077EKC2_9FLAO|nr:MULTISPECIES: prephenate dehydrogenase [Elizabethkingia]AIL46639.1 Prephenate and/or arogenate dehydrogenase (unknown specificity) 2 [Elizabethkingia anophelis NUHP1]AKH95149.1 prephenate dehydrogenase [Elizabethkingia anophelis FMS-007]AMR41323.1 prephenate dehydrogenase [Elizabethkingia anophelis]AMX47964.1 prephenate dehydrogenase [Elizabethkingia anophelis]AMX51420.1 prephenate dehydrogenase [Elizabethkingia anophelis]
MNISIIGTGLIGGSMALKLKQKGIASKIIGIDKNEEHLKEAKSLGIIDDYMPFEEGVKSADLIIVAIPVDAARIILPSILDLLNDQQTVMDVGSTKNGIIKAIKNHPNRSRYVATHPMWGTENSGPKAAMADAFTGRAAVICNQEESAKDAVELVQKVYDALEMNLLYMDSEDHDIHTAYISHISHITSYALANTVLEKEKEEDTIFQLASTGFSSTVRLAKSHPEMWVPIFRQNKENVLDVLNEHISQLRKFKSALEKENYEYLEELILKANKIRGILK